MGPLQSVLICGWADSKWMVDLLRALDVELPRGSEVVLLNMRDTQRVMETSVILCTCTFDTLAN